MDEEEEEEEAKAGLSSIFFVSRKINPFRLAIHGNGIGPSVSLLLCLFEWNPTYMVLGGLQNMKIIYLHIHLFVYWFHFSCQQHIALLVLGILKPLPNINFKASPIDWFTNKLFFLNMVQAQTVQ